MINGRQSDSAAPAVVVASCGADFGSAPRY